jgi:hypothetical protein
MILLPLLLAPTLLLLLTIIKTTKVSSRDHLTTTTPPKSPTAFAHANSSSAPEILQQFYSNKEPWIKGLETVPLSRIRFKNHGKTHHGYQQMENILLLPLSQLTILKNIYICYLFIFIGNMFRPHSSSTSPQLLSKRK